MRQFETNSVRLGQDVFRQKIELLCITTKISDTPWSVTALVAATDTSVRSVAERNASRGGIGYIILQTA